MRYTILVNGTAEAQCKSDQLANAIVDIFCGEAKEGTTIELLDRREVILAFDEKGDQVI